MRLIRSFGRGLLLPYFFLAVPLMADVKINEFLADNDSIYPDEDGDFSDWIELHNPTTTNISLHGWHLTDESFNLTKWTLPNVSIPAGGFLVIFASDKDRTNPSSELHTNFKLSNNGEYLALVRPDGSNIEQEFAPLFPEQEEDLSYGIRPNSSTTTLLAEGAACRGLVPADGALGTTWVHRVGFDDSGWLSGVTGVGYERSSGYQTFIGLDLETQLYGINASAYIRIPFLVNDANAVIRLDLWMRPDDGFIAYLNGQRIGAFNDPATPAWNSNATADHPDGSALVARTYNVADPSQILVTGTNVLAIHGLNRNTTSSDMLQLPELVADVLSTNQALDIGYMSIPTPGATNAPGVASFAEKVKFSIPSQAFTGQVSVALSVTSGAAIIHYTLDNSEPTLASPLYAGPILVNNTTMIRARAFDIGLSPGPLVSETYLELSSDILNFSSDLPLMVLESFNGGTVPQNTFEPGFWAIYEQDEMTGRTRIEGIPETDSRAGFRIRGSSSAGLAKKSFAVESWDGAGEDRGIKPLGLPRESDWILYAPFQFDRAFMRNPFIYELSNQTRNFAVRTRFCELFLNTDGGPLSTNDYYGVFVFMEKIKRDNNR
ncbi:MAG: CotH kinase family protein, partial [Verrucomicrobiota bacterium]